jgi:hypothetical protein
MVKTKFVTLNNDINLKNITHIIYAHSFLETQYMLGTDGFINYEHWLTFTIKELSKNKDNTILVKAHPNFYTKNFSNINYIDSIVFKGIKKKFQKNLNIFFLDYPYKNYELLNNVNKKTIIIIRHSSALFEAIYFGFKVIFSEANIWDNKYLRASNSWGSINKYKSLLNKNWNDLEYFSQRSFYRLGYDLFCNTKNFFGGKSWDRLLSNKLKISFYNLNKQSSYALSEKRIININKFIAKNSIAYVNN